MTNAKLAKSARAALDEIIATGSEGMMTAICTLLQHYAELEGAVEVTTSKKTTKATTTKATTTKPGRTSKAKAKDDDEDVIEEDEEDDAEDDNLVEDDDDGEDDGDDDGEGGEDDEPSIDSLDEETVADYFAALGEFELEIPDEYNGGIREVSAMIKELGGDPAEIAPKEAGTPSERTLMLQSWLASIDLASAEIADKFELSDILSAYEEIAGEALTVKGTAKAKLAAAARAYALAVAIGVEEDEEDEED